jgi:hypothetical protein
MLRNDAAINFSSLNAGMTTEMFKGAGVDMALAATD